MHHIQCDPSAARSQRVKWPPTLRCSRMAPTGRQVVQEFVLYSAQTTGRGHRRLRSVNCELSTVDYTTMKIR